MFICGRINRGWSLPASLLILAFSLSACGPRASGQEKRYDLKGKLVSIDEKGRQLIIAHEPIPDFMEAMTMPFSVKEGWPFKDMQPGDTIQATLVVDGATTWLENVMWSRQTDDPTAAADAASSTDPKPGDEVPDFTLVNQDGKAISLRGYRGRALALTFVYTRCPLPDYCPLMSERFATIEKSLATEPDLYAKTHLLSITVDPEYDRPEVMREYGRLYAGKGGGPSFSHWEFATGSLDQVKNAARYFGLTYWQEAGQIIHNLRTAVIAPDGKLLKLYQGNQWKPEDILSDLESLKSANSD